MGITLKDVAEYTGTSIATVSNVLGNKKMRVSEETRKRILDAAHKLGYTPNAAGLNLKKGCTDTIAVIVGDLLYPYYAKLLKEISNQLRVLGKNTVICDIDNSYENEREHLLRLKTGYVDGCIVVPSPSASTEEHYNFINSFLQSFRIPAVIITGNGEVRYPKLNTVATDPYKSAFFATEHLIKLGHYRIAFVSEMEDDGEFNRKLVGYKDALESHSIKYDRSLVVSGFARYSGGNAAYNLVAKTDATAVICSNDQIAIGCCAEAMDRGVKVPKELSIVGMDNTMAGRQQSPQLTTVDQKVEEIAAVAIKMLLQKDKDDVMHIDLEPEMIVRQSTCEPRTHTL